MSHAINRLRLLAILGCAALGAAMAAKTPQSPIPETYTNLQIMRKDIPRSELVPVMRAFAITLGVRCAHCHVGEGNDLATFDFASDARPAKAVARRMMTMVQAINGPLLEGVGAPAKPDAPKVTCFTCHRGAKLPLTVPGEGGAD